MSECVCECVCERVISFAERFTSWKEAFTSSLVFDILTMRSRKRWRVGVGA